MQQEGRSPSSHNFFTTKSNSSYIFRLHEAATIGTYVSENVKIKLYTGSIDAIGFVILKAVCPRTASCYAGNILHTVHTARHLTLQHHNSYNRTDNHRQWNAVGSPDDGHKDARNMLR